MISILFVLTAEKNKTMTVCAHPATMRPIYFIEVL